MTKTAAFLARRPAPVVQKLAFFVHFYDATKNGTWRKYFALRADAEAFAVGKTVWGKPCRVEETK